MSPAAQPSRAACPARSYWRSVDSVCSRTCIRVDWRTYTIAVRSRWARVTFCSSRITAAHLRRRFAGCRERAAGQRGPGHVGQQRDHLRPARPAAGDGGASGQAAAHRLVQLPPGQQLQVDRRDLLQRLPQPFARSPGGHGPHRPAPPARRPCGPRLTGTHTARAIRLARTGIPPSRSGGAARPASRPGTPLPAAARPPAGPGAERSSAVDSAARSFLCVFITQETAR